MNRIWLLSLGLVFATASLRPFDEDDVFRIEQKGTSKEFYEAIQDLVGSMIFPTMDKSFWKREQSQPVQKEQSKQQDVAKNKKEETKKPTLTEQQAKALDTKMVQLAELDMETANAAFKKISDDFASNTLSYKEAIAYLDNCIKEAKTKKEKEEERKAQELNNNQEQGDSNAVSEVKNEKNENPGFWNAEYLNIGGVSITPKRFGIGITAGIVLFMMSKKS